MTLVNADKLTSPGDDYVKNVETYMNIARAIDLYLALENAYTKWTGHSRKTIGILERKKTRKVSETLRVCGIIKVVRRYYETTKKPAIILYRSVNSD